MKEVATASCCKLPRFVLVLKHAKCSIERFVLHSPGKVIFLLQIYPSFFDENFDETLMKVLEYFSNLFVKDSTRNVRELRNTETDLSLPLRKTKSGQNAISFRGPKVWNQLALDLKLAPSHAIFKKTLKN